MPPVQNCQITIKFRVITSTPRIFFTPKRLCWKNWLPIPKKCHFLCGDSSWQTDSTNKLIGCRVYRWCNFSSLSFSNNEKEIFQKGYIRIIRSTQFSFRIYDVHCGTINQLLSIYISIFHYCKKTSIFILAILRYKLIKYYRPAMIIIANLFCNNQHTIPSPFSPHYIAISSLSLFNRKEKPQEQGYAVEAKLFGLESLQRHELKFGFIFRYNTVPTVRKFFPAFISDCS